MLFAKRGTFQPRSKRVRYFCWTIVLIAVSGAPSFSQSQPNSTSGVVPSALPAGSAGRCQQGCLVVAPGGLNCVANLPLIQQPAQPPKGNFELTIPLLQSLVWPLLIAGILITWRSEILKLLGRVISVKVGNLELLLAERIDSVSTPAERVETVPVELLPWQ
jgi:hypothetical protein